MLSRSVLALGSLVVAAVAVLAQGQNPGPIHGQLINGCEIDLRPKTRPEAQVYWADGAANQYGMQYEVYVVDDNKLTAAAWDGSGPVALKKGRVNLVKFNYDRPTHSLMMSISNDLTVVPQPAAVPVSFTGTFDPLGLLVEPVMTEVRSGTSNADIDCVRITVTNYGLTYSFTLRGAVP